MVEFRRTPAGLRKERTMFTGLGIILLLWAVVESLAAQSGGNQILPPMTALMGIGFTIIGGADKIADAIIKGKK